MWSISIEPPKIADVKLASISIESPVNMRSSEDFGLLVGLWCQLAREPIHHGDTTHIFRFGFLEGEVVVDHTGGRILNRDRLEIIESAVKTAQSESNKTEKGYGLDAKIGLAAKFLEFFNVGSGIEGQARKTISKSTEKNFERHELIWKVANSNYNVWYVSGIALNQDNVLQHRILGKEPLCYFTIDELSTTMDIRVQVSFRCDLRNLWLERDDETPITRDRRFNEANDERNRIAVSAIIIKGALNRHHFSNDHSYREGTIILATQDLYAARQSASAPQSK
jgi:hypothetical protein